LRTFATANKTMVIHPSGRTSDAQLSQPGIFYAIRVATRNIHLRLPSRKTYCPRVSHRFVSNGECSRFSVSAPVRFAGLLTKRCDMITQDIEKRVLERLSLADEVSKYGVITDNPGDEVWPFKAECVFPRPSRRLRESVENYADPGPVLLSRSKRAFLIDDGKVRHTGDVLEFLYQIRLMTPFKYPLALPDQRFRLAGTIACLHHWNVWED